MLPSKETMIIGGGWAGIATAIHLAKHQYGPITLIESADQLGGRARNVMFGDTPVDNGQHIALGAYRNLLELLSIIGLDESRVLSRWPLGLQVDGAQGLTRLSAPKLPAPLHLLIAFLNAQGFSMDDKRKTLLNWPRLIGKQAADDLTVTNLLKQTGQSEKVGHYLWKPLCIAALNTSPDKASARIFQRVLKDAFMRRRADSDLLIPRFDMSHILPLPAQDWLTHQGVTIVKSTRATGLLHDAGKITGIQLGDETHHAKQVVIATNPWSCAALIKDLPGCNQMYHNLEQFKYEPIATVYLKYKRPVLLDPPMQGFADSLSQWIFDRRITSHPKILAVVISADGQHAHQNKEELIQQVINEVKAMTPVKEDPVNSMLIREKRATFSATPEIEQLRPTNQTPMDNCWLAGDYTQTGYPATLEGAIISGKQCAQVILNTNP